MLKKIALVVVALVVVLVVVIAMRPAEFRIARSRTMAASPDVIYGYVSDFKTWPQWSPWEKLDPALKREYSGAPAGPGAVYAWTGNGDVGEGRMTITGAQPGRNVTLKLEFIKPFAATNTAQFDFVPSGQGTNVTWAMSGRNNFMAKAIGLFLSIEQFVGTQFEEGLAKLDTVTAAKAANPVAAR